MDRPAKKHFRCAIYTRKSTDHNLDLEFNSLDAQREACEAYIKSQAHEGWRLVPARYDDGAFSGASLDRPALQKLLAEVQSGKIDIIVVYKVDRLTRSLADFAKLVELFDQHSVSFVSVTQSFNTTNSMGRLTLNVLLSFAQFEREVIGERVRDKIAASKAKGIWVGGSVPLGYASVKKKLVIVPEEAETVRLIFRRYLELGSIRKLAEDLDRRGIRTRRQILSSGQARGGVPFTVGPLGHLLRNHFYIGEVVYRGQVYAGEHEPIVDRELFEAVQAKLAAAARTRQLRLRSSPAILAGRIFDDRGNRMASTHTNKRGARYRYYVSQAVLQKRNKEAGRVARVPAHEIETYVLEALRDHLGLSAPIEHPSPGTDRDLIERHIAAVIIKMHSIEVHLRSQAEHGDAGQASDGSNRPHTKSGASATVVTIPWTPTPASRHKGIAHSPAPTRLMTEENRDVLLTAIAKSRTWVHGLAAGTASFAEIAKREGKVDRHVRLMAQLAFISPKIVSAIAVRTVPNLKVTDLARAAAASWAEQQNRVGL